MHYIISRADHASVNIGRQMLNLQEWKGADDLWQRGDDHLLITDRFHVEFEDAVEVLTDATRSRPELICVLSRHRAASGRPAFSTHPLGNYHAAKYGGQPGYLAPAAPEMMSAALRALIQHNSIDDFAVTFEATHHGPGVAVPIFFLELGSSEAQWDRQDAAMVVARAALDLKPQPYPNLVGVGGSHYVPRHNDIVRRHQVNIGHMVPTYALEASEDPLVPIRLAIAATPACQGVYIDKKGIKKPLLRQIKAGLEREGIESFSSKSFPVIEPVTL